VLIAIANPAVIPIFLPLAWLFVRVRAYYLTTSREAKRLEAITRSPVYAMFSVTMKGLPTIRAYKVAPRFRQHFLSALQLNGSWWMAFLSCSRWAPCPHSFLAALRLHAPRSGCTHRITSCRWPQPHGHNSFSGCLASKSIPTRAYHRGSTVLLSYDTAQSIR
jgi:hypothetical protein